MGQAFFVLKIAIMIKNEEFNQKEIVSLASLYFHIFFNQYQKVKF